jgi:hypothetical protein
MKLMTITQEFVQQQAEAGEDQHVSIRAVDQEPGAVLARFGPVEPAALDVVQVEHENFGRTEPDEDLGQHGDQAQRREVTRPQPLAPPGVFQCENQHHHRRAGHADEPQPAFEHARHVLAGAHRRQDVAQRQERHAQQLPGQGSRARHRALAPGVYGTGQGDGQDGDQDEENP